ncbi:hypothetical protein E3O55_05580 [Cryobacterium sp. MDB1-18-2]|uniref:Uncharacterized protein n=1 Tax=Cryobacterium glucosi TaxID=1259175 RepID=A0ABY2IPJ1_9MICO|nr:MULTISPECIES: hypothetical protein [Cryobacterium]TFC21836.1 hypothetical protein E3O46_06400 [Cryobacterium glucosi]TFC32369.1 hypothetical protein E3O55_05580 [Cryobacterium sp. MDB1-18-2]TFC46094.1 hypothetical protein E3O50_01965 [Cryobacterium sp. MDB1-18-1]
MKRITYAGGSIVTGDAVTAALLDFATHLDPGAGSLTVDIPVRETNGATTTHTFLFGPASQFEVADAENLPTGDEGELFPVPVFPTSRPVAVTEPSPAAETGAEDFNRAILDIDGGLGQGATT